MRLIQGYLFRQIGLPVAAACAALIGIGLLSQSLDQLEIVVERGQSLFVMLRLTLLAVPQLLAIVLPIGLFVGALIALTRLQREQELTAIFAAGMRRWSVIAPMAAIAGVVAAIALTSTTLLQPWSQQAGRDELFAIRTDLAALLVQEGQFVQGPDGLTVYVQQIEQSGLLRNIFVYLQDGDKVTTWDAAEARFETVADEPQLTLINGSAQEFSSNGVLNQFSFGRFPFSLAAFTDVDETVRYKPSDLYLPTLFAPSPEVVERSGTRGELLAEAHARLTSPLYAFTAMAMAMAAILGGSFSRTGYSGRIAKASAFFLLVRIVGFGLVSASAWNGWLNLFQYLLPLAATAVSLRVLFRALKPHRRAAFSLRRLGPQTA